MFFLNLVKASFIITVHFFSLNSQARINDNVNLSLVSHLYKNYEILLTDAEITDPIKLIEIENKLLENFGYSRDSIKHFSKYLSNYINGTFYPQLEFTRNTESCNVYQEKFNSIGSLFDLKRLDILSKGGISVLFLIMELNSFVENLNKLHNETSEYYQQICDRVLTISNALKVVHNEPSRFNAEEFFDITKIDFEKYMDGEKTLFVDDMNSSLKSALHRFEPFLIHQLVNQQSKSNKVIINLSAPIKEDDIYPIIFHSIKDHAIEQISLNFVNYYLKLPANVRSKIEPTVSLVGSVELKEALEIINSYQYVADAKQIITKFKGKILRQDELYKAYNELVSSYKILGDFIKDSNFNDPIFNNINNTLDEIKNAAEDAKDKIIEKGCNEVTDNLKRPIWNMNMWGLIPSPEKPIGIRFTAEEDSSTRREKHNGKKPHIVSIELLFLADKILEKTAPAVSDACAINIGVNYVAIDLGINVYYVYKGDKNEYPFSKGYYTKPATSITGQVNHLNASAEQFKKALGQIGLLGHWLGSKPKIEMSDDFKSLSLELNLSNDSIQIPIIKNGKVVFEPKTAGILICQSLENKLIPNLSARWVDNYDLAIDDWSLKVNNKIDSFVNLPACETFYDRQKGHKLASLETSNVHAVLDLLLSGKISGKKLDWPISLIADAGLGGFEIKEIAFGELPPVLKSILTSKLEDLTRPINQALGERVDIGVYLSDIHRFKSFGEIILPLEVQVSTSQCAPISFETEVGFPDLSFKLDNQQIEGSIVAFAKCEGIRRLESVLLDTVDCNQLNFDFLGISFESKDSKSKNNRNGLKQCEINFSASFNEKTIDVTGVQAKVLAVDKIDLDFSRAKENGTLIPFVEEKVKGVLDDFVDGKLEFENSRFSKNAFHVDLSAKIKNLGMINFGTLTIPINGDLELNLNTDLYRILSRKLNTVIKPQFEKFARSILPKSVESISINTDLSTVNDKIKLSVTADLIINVYEDIRINQRIDLFPDLNFKFDMEAVKGQIRQAVFDKLNDLFSFSDKVEFELLDIQFSPNYDITLVFAISLKLDTLGEISADSVYISKRGVKVKGRIEARVGIAIPLFATPPVFLTRPGVFYDHENNQIGALGALTIIAPHFDKIVQIDAEIITDDLDNFLSTLTLTGELIMYDSLSMASVEGVVDFNEKSIGFEAASSELLAKIFSASINGGFNTPKKNVVGLYTAVSLFGLDILRTFFEIHPNDCPGACIKNNVRVNLGFGEASINSEIDPLIVDSRFGTDFNLEVFGKSFGSASFSLSIFHAKLTATILKKINLSITTPSKREMTEAYIASVIASLLNIDLKDILKWLENPKVKFAPAGDPSSGDNNSNNNGNGNQDMGTGTVVPVTTNRNPEIDTNVEATNDKPLFQGAPTQRESSNNGNSFWACRKKNDYFEVGTFVGRYMFSFVSRGLGRSGLNNNNSVFHFYPRYNISKENANSICVPSNPQPLLKIHEESKPAFFINDDYRPIRVFGSIHHTEKLNFESCDSKLAVDGNKYDCNLSMPEANISYSSTSRIAGDLLTRSKFRKLYVRDKNAKVIEDEIVLNIPDNIFAELSNFDDLLEDKKANKLNSRKMRKYKTALKYLLKYLRDYENIYAQEIISFEPEWRIGRMFSKFVGVEVNFKSIEEPKVETYSELVNVWVDMSAQNVIMEHNCFSENMKIIDCLMFFNKDGFDNSVFSTKAKVWLDGNGLLQKNKFVELNPFQAYTFVNDIIPNIISGNDFFKYTDIDIDSDFKIKNCEVDRISYAADQNSIYYQIQRISKFSDDSTSGKVLSISINKSDFQWAQDENVDLIGLMGNFLACNDDPQGWLQNNKLWLPTMSSELIYYTAHPTLDSKFELTQISDSGVKNHAVPVFNPYYPMIKRTLTKGEKEGLFKQLDVLNTDVTLDIFINESLNLEVTRLKSMNGAFYQARQHSCWNNDSSSVDSHCANKFVLKNDDVLNQTTPIKDVDLDDCLYAISQSNDNDMFKKFIESKDLINRYGIGPIELLKYINTKPKTNCSLN